MLLPLDIGKVSYLIVVKQTQVLSSWHFSFQIAILSCEYRKIHSEWIQQWDDGSFNLRLLNLRLNVMFL